MRRRTEEKRKQRTRTESVELRRCERVEEELVTCLRLSDLNENEKRQKNAKEQRSEERNVERMNERKNRQSGCAASFFFVSLTGELYRDYVSTATPLCLLSSWHFCHLVLFFLLLPFFLYRRLRAHWE